MPDAVPLSAAGHVADKAQEEINAAVDDALGTVASAAQGIKETAQETVNAAVLQTLGDLHASVQQLLSRDQFNPGALEAINAEIARLHARMDELSGPARDALAALENVATAAAETVQEEAAEDSAEVGIPVSIEDPTAPPKSAKKAKKAFFGKKKGKG